MSNPDLLPADVLRRKAVVYVRQSTQTQVQVNLESKRRQYDLVQEARRRGFQRVEVIDDDLGRSASGTVERPGFDRLVAWLCAGEVGAVLPGQTQHQGVELWARQLQRAGRISRPDELAGVQPPGGQPYADAVVHQHLHAVGAPVGEEVGVVRDRRAEDADHARQRGFGAQAHVQGLHGQPNRINADRPSASRSQAALRSSMGSLACTVALPRWISTVMSAGSGADAGAGFDSSTA
jgi:hypothetical protein